MKLNLFLLLSWTLMAVVTWKAVTLLGINWPSVFFGDILNHPWRAQFNIDFLIHLFLFASWVVWRERSKVTGLICGFLCIFGGGLFGFLYLLAFNQKVIQVHFLWACIAHKKLTKNDYLFSFALL